MHNPSRIPKLSVVALVLHEIRDLVLSKRLKRYNPITKNFEVLGFIISVRITEHSHILQSGSIPKATEFWVTNRMLSTLKLPASAGYAVLSTISMVSKEEDFKSYFIKPDTV